MNESAVTHISVNPRSLLTPIVLLAATTLFAGLVGSAAAAPVAADGKVYACYKVKGKPKGAMRILPRAKARCRRGERKVGLIAVGVSGQPAAIGQQGGTGPSGSAGPSGAAGGSTGSSDDLQAKVSSLSLKVDGLEDLLGGITEGDLTGVLDKLSGITEGDLTEAVDASELIGELCDQTEALTAQVNLLEGVIDGLGLNGILEGLGGLLEIPTLPGSLDPFACSAP